MLQLGEKSVSGNNISNNSTNTVLSYEEEIVRLITMHIQSLNVGIEVVPHLHGSEM